MGISWREGGRQTHKGGDIKEKKERVKEDEVGGQVIEDSLIYVAFEEVE